MLSKKLQDYVRSILLAGYRAQNADQKKGVAFVAHALADDHCTGQERYHFLLACGVPFEIPK